MASSKLLENCELARAWLQRKVDGGAYLGSICAQYKIPEGEARQLLGGVFTEVSLDTVNKLVSYNNAE